MKHCALALEGGALRGVYTSGVIDVMMEHDLEYGCVAGVSAGALNGLSYVSHQPGWAARINLEYIHDPRYIGVVPLLESRSLFGYDFMFGQLITQLERFDSETFFQSKQGYAAAATNCLTGEAKYFERDLCRDIMQAARASASLPYAAPMVNIDGVPYLDGGVSVAAPVDWLLHQGYQRVVAVLTHPKGYRRPPITKAKNEMAQLRYRQFPGLVCALQQSAARYNQEMTHYDELEAAGKLFVVRPQAPCSALNIELDTKRLRQLYLQGRAEAETVFPALDRFLHGSSE